MMKIQTRPKPSRLLPDLHSRRLWHQLTDKLELVVNDHGFATVMVELYPKFIYEFATKVPLLSPAAIVTPGRVPTAALRPRSPLPPVRPATTSPSPSPPRPPPHHSPRASLFCAQLNQLRLAQVCVKIASHYPSPADAIAFLEGVMSRMRERKEPSLDAQPLLFLTMSVAQLQLQAGETIRCREMLRDGEAALGTLSDVHPAVSAAVHWTAATYAKGQQDFRAFYQSAVQYLAFINVEELDLESRTRLAVDIGLAALLGDAIYGFGELLLHPIVETLSAAPYQWLRDILHCFERGDMEGYDALCVKYADALNAQPALVENERKLREKITILSLMELVFKYVSWVARQGPRRAKRRSRGGFVGHEGGMKGGMRGA